MACIYILQPVLAQQPELINSADVIEKAANLNGESKYKKAIELYKTVPPSDSNYSDVLHELAFTAYLDSDYNAGLNYAKQGMNLFPEKADDWYNLTANILDAEGKYAEAINYYDSSLKLNAYNYYTWFNKGLALYNFDKKKEAQLCFQRALLINPYHTSSHFYLGVIYTEQGKLPQALLCFVTNLLINPENRYLNKSVNYLSVISKVTDEINSYALKATEAKEDNFDFLQEILLSKAALDTKYKLQTDVDDPITRQLQVLLEKLEYDTNDKGFCMQYYVPFYTGIFKNGEFNVLINYIFSGLDIKSVKNYNDKNKKLVEALKDSSDIYLNLIRRTELADYTARLKADYKFYYGDNSLTGIGKWTNNGSNDILVGPWEFFYDNGQLKSKGIFNANSEKEGEWKFYYNNGVLRERSTFKNGKADGKDYVWFDNGNLSQEKFYELGNLNGEVKSYYFNALPKSVEHYKNDLKDGETKTYTYDGFLNYVAGYEKDELHGPITFYYKNGNTATIKNYTNGKLNGPYRNYTETGVVDMEGNYVDDKPAGTWKEYYDSKVLKAGYAYTDGEINGPYKMYFENWKPSQVTQYVNGKIDGKEEDFDEDGIKYGEATYEKGKLKELNFFDKSGKVISTSTTRKGTADLTFYDAWGNKTSEGYYNKDGDADGKATYYFKSGKVKTEVIFKAGSREGERKIYYPNGIVNEKINFTNDKENGLLTTYYLNGAIKYAGNFVDGDKQGEHQRFNIFNTMQSSLNFEDDEQNGYNTYYAPDGKKTFEEKYRTGWLLKATQFDTTGKIIAETNFPAGKGTLIYKHLNGNVSIKVNYLNYAMQGKYESFYFDGSPLTMRYYKNGLEDSIYKSYNYGGKLSQEGHYIIGSKRRLMEIL